MFSIIAFLLFTVSEAQPPCQKSFLTEPEYIVCYQIFSYDYNSRKITVGRGTSRDLTDVDSNGNRRYAPGVREAQLEKQKQDDKAEFDRKLAGSGSNPPARAKRQTHPAGLIWDCMDVACICGFMPGASMFTSLICQLADGSFYGQVVRKDFRVMSTPERNLFAAGFKAVRSSIYWTLSGFHGNASSCPGAHSGPNFLPWHREFLKRLEIGIRTFRLPNGTYPYVNVAMPYWDSSMDYDVYNIFVWFSSFLLGSVKTGYLTNGFFGLWSGRDGQTYRNLDQWPGQIWLYSRAEVEAIINNPAVNSILAATAGNPANCPAIDSYNCEVHHGWCHVYIGGHMQSPLTSTNDPIFFMHHSFVDFIWEQWRLKNQDRFQRESQWSTAALSCYSSAHAKTAVMLPFLGKVNQDGLSNKYTDYLYTYQLRPTCSLTNKSCGSAFLWCYLPAGRCVSRLPEGQRCSIINGVDPCFATTCYLGYCRPIGVPGNTGKPGNP